MRKLSQVFTLNFLSPRYFATKLSPNTNPLLNTLFEELVKKRKSPCYELFSSQIQILYEPIDFYLALNVFFEFVIKNIERNYSS